MTTHDNATPPADWSTPAKPWDERACCPATCAGVCEAADNVIRGDN